MVIMSPWEYALSVVFVSVAVAQAAWVAAEIWSHEPWQATSVAKDARFNALTGKLATAVVAVAA
jgi:hypothetical protein